MHNTIRYLVPMSALVAVCTSFLLVRRFRPLGGKARIGVAIIAALPLVGSGTLHLLAPSAFLPLLPSWVPDRPLIIMLTGLPELAGAVGLFVPRLQRAAGLWLAILMVAIFPANVFVAGQRVDGLQMPGVPLRTAMQAAYIVLLLVAGFGLPRLTGESH